MSITANVTSSKISATVSGDSVTASVASGRVAAAVTGGIGPQGPSGDTGETGGAATLSELTDVQLTSPANGDLIQYSAATSKWRNVTDLSLVDGGNFAWLIAFVSAGLQALQHLSRS
jgi:hypothetical protein